MEKEEVREKIITLISRRTVRAALINPEDDLRGTLELDSLDMFELLLDCEIIFDIALGEGTDEVKTVQNLIDLVFEKIQC